LDPLVHKVPQVLSVMMVNKVLLVDVDNQVYKVRRVSLVLEETEKRVTKECQVCQENQVVRVHQAEQVLLVKKVKREISQYQWLEKLVWMDHLALEVSQVQRERKDQWVHQVFPAITQMLRTLLDQMALLDLQVLKV